MGITSISMLFYYLIAKFTSLWFVSLFINSILIFLTERKVFGSYLQNLVLEIPKSRTNAIFISIIYFLFVFIIIFTVRYNMTPIWLDPVTVNVSVNGINANFTQDIFSFIKETLGDTAVILGCARLSYLIVSKNSALKGLTKIGIIIGSGGGGLTTYKVVDNSLNSLGVSRETVVLSGNLQLNSATITTTGNYNIPDHPVLGYIFGMNQGVSLKNIQTNYNINTDPQGITTIRGHVTSEILNDLKKHNPNWDSKFFTINIGEQQKLKSFIINSPNEEGTSLIGFLIDILTDQFILCIISLYLLFMLLIIFICKLILSTDIEFKTISKIKILNWNIGEKINRLIIWYIGIWQKASSFWIFFIITMLFIFIGAVLFSTFAMLKRLKDIS